MELGPLPVYGLVFGGMDRVFGAWALLRYPNPVLRTHQRVYLILLTGWMLVGRTAIAVTSTARWNGGPATWWWPALLPDQRVADVLNVVVNAVEGLFGLVFLVMLVMRLVRTAGLDRIVIPPIIMAGMAATIAAIASAIAQLAAGVSARRPTSPTWWKASWTSPCRWRSVSRRPSGPCCCRPSPGSPRSFPPEPT